MPDRKANQMPKNYAPYIALCWGKLGLLEEFQILSYNASEGCRCIRQPTAREFSCGAANENSVNDRGAGSVNVNRSAHFGWTRQRSGANETGIKHCNGHRKIGIKLVVMISESQRTPRV